MCSKFCHVLTTVGVFVLFFSAIPYALSATVKGRVTDSEGTAINGAEVLFHLDPSGGGAKSAPHVNAFRQTDAKGSFEIQLKPGFYDLCVMASAFTPECSKILVTNEKTTQYDFRLNASPLIVKHLGDQF